MSFIGTLEQYNLSSVLQRVETHAKAGLLTLKSEATWVELYFRGGQLICIGPVRTNASLGERLVHDGIISAQALHEVVQTISPQELSETKMALTLMSLGYVGQEDLRAWATQKAREVLQVLLQWPNGEIHFEEDVAPPVGRLLVGLSVTTLLSPALLTRSTDLRVPAQPANGGAPASQNPTLVAPTPPASDIASMVTITNASQFSADTSSFSASSLLSADELQTPIFDVAETSASLDAEVSFASLNQETSFASLNDSRSAFSGGLTPPERVISPVPPPRIDTTFMKPDMILVPADLSTFTEQNPRIQLTPDEWRVLTCVNGQKTLRVVSQELSMQSALVCQIVGELMALGIVQVTVQGTLPAIGPSHDVSPVSRESHLASLNSGALPSYAAAPRPPALPTSDVLPQHSAQPAFAADARWGQSGNLATIERGRVATSQLSTFPSSTRTPAGIVR